MWLVLKALCVLKKRTRNLALAFFLVNLSFDFNVCAFRLFLDVNAVGLWEYWTYTLDKASQSVLTWALEVQLLLLLLRLFGIQQFGAGSGSLGPRQLVSSVETKVFNRSRYWLYSSTSLWPAPWKKTSWSTGRKCLLVMIIDQLQILWLAPHCC